MSHQHFATRKLSLKQKLDLLRRAVEKCDHWWVDILDCSKSFCRQKIEMSFEEILKKLDNRSHFCIIHRNLPPIKDYLEIGFSTMNALRPDYFLWIILDIKHLEEFTALCPKR